MFHAYWHLKKQSRIFLFQRDVLFHDRSQHFGTAIVHSICEPIAQTTAIPKRMSSHCVFPVLLFCSIIVPSHSHGLFWHVLIFQKDTRLSS
jgi:hypothetical protein